MKMNEGLQGDCWNCGHKISEHWIEDFNYTPCNSCWEYGNDGKSWNDVDLEILDKMQLNKDPRFCLETDFSFKHVLEVARQGFG